MKTPLISKSIDEHAKLVASKVIESFRTKLSETDFASVANIASVDFQPFDDQDWAAFQGAESFQGGEEPLYGEITVVDDEKSRQCAVIIGGSGVEIIDTEEGTLYQRVSPEKIDRHTADQIARNFKPRMTVSDLEDIGFDSEHQVH